MGGRGENIMYFSNQFPTTPRADRRPPIWIPSLFHLSCPLKME